MNVNSYNLSLFGISGFLVVIPMAVVNLDRTMMYLVPTVLSIFGFGFCDFSLFYSLICGFEIHLLQQAIIRAFLVLVTCSSYCLEEIHSS